MIVFTNDEGTEYPTTLVVDALKDNPVIYAVDGNDGASVPCNWSLKNAGPYGSSFFGSLAGFSSDTYVTDVTLSDQTSVTYLPPNSTRLWKGILNLLLVATSLLDGTSRTLQITVAHPSEGQFAG